MKSNRVILQLSLTWEKVQLFFTYVQLLFTFTYFVILSLIKAKSYQQTTEASVKKDIKIPLKTRFQSTAHKEAVYLTA